MKRYAMLVLIVALFLPLTTSCSTMQALKPVKAGYDAENDQGWASRYIPGVKAVSKFIPPPTEARKKWDERYKRWNNASDAEDKFPDL
jgi:hypothetical protein